MRPVSVEPVKEINRTSLWLTAANESAQCPWQNYDAFGSGSSHDFIQLRSKRHIFACFMTTYFANKRGNQFPRRNCHRKVNASLAANAAVGERTSKIYSAFGLRRKPATTTSHAEISASIAPAVAAGFLQTLPISRVSRRKIYLCRALIFWRVWIKLRRVSRRVTAQRVAAFLRLHRSIDIVFHRQRKRPITSLYLPIYIFKYSPSAFVHSRQVLW